MAITQVQLVNYDATPSNTSFTIPIASTTAGNFLVILYSTRNVTATATDNLFNIYTVATSVTTSIRGTGILYLKNIPSGITSITVTLSSSNIAGITVIEYSGVHLTSPIDVTSSNSGGSGPYLGPSLTTSNADDILLNTICTTNSSGTPTVDSPWTGVVFQAEFGGLLSSLTPGTTGTFQATYHNYIGEFSSSGIALVPGPITFSLTLSDSSSVLDSVSGFNKAVNASDNVTSTDSFPNSFSVQSSFIATNPTPSVETLTNAVIPSEVKTFWKFQ